MGPLRLSEKLLPHRPIFGERLLRFLAVRNDAFLVSFAAHTQDTLFLLDVDQIQAGKFTDPQPCSIKKLDRKSTRLNSSHGYISYAVFCLKKKKKHMTHSSTNMQ